MISRLPDQEKQRTTSKWCCSHMFVEQQIEAQRVRVYNILDCLCSASRHRALQYNIRSRRESETAPNRASTNKLPPPPQNQNKFGSVLRRIGVLFLLPRTNHLCSESTACGLLGIENLKQAKCKQQLQQYAVHPSPKDKPTRVRTHRVHLGEHGPQPKSLVCKHVLRHHGDHHVR